MEFADKFEIEKLHIKQVGSWIISVRPQQVTLGSLVLSLDRKCHSLGALTGEEGADLALAFKVIDDILKKSFNPDQINYLALMMVDKQVHFHVIPRYSSTIKFNEREYLDEKWPKPPVVSEVLPFTQAEFVKLKNYLKSNI